MSEFEARDLFTLPEMDQQEELLALSPVPRIIDSPVTDPVAHVRLDLPQPHLDREFDYEIPESMAEVPVGARIQVNLGSRKVDGFILSRDSSTSVAGKLRPIRKVYSNDPVLSLKVAKACEIIARDHLASMADALRLAVPQRHARAEKQFRELPPITHPIWDPPASLGAWEHFDAGQAFLSHVAAGDAPRAVLTLAPALKTLDVLVTAIQAALAGRRGVLVIVPTPVASARFARHLGEAFPGEPIAQLVSDDDHERRYTQFLSVKTGRARIAIGTRNAVWAPVNNLGLVIVVDDLHVAMREQRSPYHHARAVARVRAQIEDTALLVVGYRPSLEAMAWVTKGFAVAMEATPSQLLAPQILDSRHFAYEGSTWARMPSSVFSVIREGLDSGPVLVIVPRNGYIPLVACDRCRTLASCVECGSHLEIPGPNQPATCPVCGHVEQNFHCSVCAGTRLRPAKIGSHRTAHEVGRAFRGVSIHQARPGVTEQLDNSPKIVVATPGTEPEVRGGYRAAVILDAGYLAQSGRLSSDEYFIRAIAHVASRVVPKSSGGKLLIVGDFPGELTKALHDPRTWVFEALVSRAELGQPPIDTWVELTGEWEALRALLATIRAGAVEAGTIDDSAFESLDVILTRGSHGVIPGMSVLGPTNTRLGYTVYLRFSHDDSRENLDLIYNAIREISVRRTARAVRVQVDPLL